MNFTVPMKLPSVANLREHWSKTAGRQKAHRSATRLLAYAHFGPRKAVELREALTAAGASLEVVLVRIAPRKLDTDNLGRSLKGVQDGLADWIGIDDGDDRLAWKYRNEKGAPGTTALRVELRLVKGNGDQ